MSFLLSIYQKILKLLLPSNIVTQEDLRLRRMIWLEYQARNTEEEAWTNIRRKLNYAPVSMSTIQHWYDHFKCGETSLFDKDTLQYGITQATQILPNGDEKEVSGPILFICNNVNWKTVMVTPNGRFAILFEFIWDYSTKLHICDLFYNETKVFKKDYEMDYKNISQLAIIDEHYLLMITKTGLAVVKIDYESQSLIFIQRIFMDFAEMSHIIYQYSQRNILIYNDSQFITGKYVKNQIILDSEREFDFRNFKWPKLDGNKLFGFTMLNRQNNAGIRLTRYRELHLGTLAENSIEVPFNNSIRGWRSVNYSWSGNRLYVVLFNENYKDCIFTFDSKNFVCTKIGIKIYGHISAIFVDENHFLTLQATYSSYLKKHSIYRFALKKPDTLNNIVWFHIRRQDILFNGKIYRIICEYFSPMMPLKVNNKRVK